MKNRAPFTFLFLAFFLFGLHKAQAQATLLSHFKFTSSLVDDLGMGTLTPVGNSGLFYAGGALQWIADSIGTGGGFRYTVDDGSFTEDNYSVALTFQFTETSGYRKIIDCSQLLNDAGVYVNGQLRLYGLGGYGDSTLLPNTWYTLLMTRSAVEDTARLYLLVDGSSFKLESKADDMANAFVSPLNGAERVMEFFHDDSSTVDEFSSGGMVDELRIWNGLVDPEDVIAAVEEGNALEGIVAYPNPSAGSLTVEFSRQQTGKLQVFDLCGKLVMSHGLTGARFITLDVQSLRKGMYLLRMNGESLRFVRQ